MVQLILLASYTIHLESINANCLLACSLVHGKVKHSIVTSECES